MDILLSFLLAFTSCLTVVNSACLTLPVVENAGNNATAPGPFPDGTTVQFTCHDGYMPSGNRIYDCNGSTWINGNFECDEIFCKHVETPRNGNLKDSPTYEVGSFITFRCNEGYTMKGTSRLICRIDGQWSPDKAPECEIKNCGDFGEVLHGSTFQDNSETERNTYGSVVQVTCDRGYMLTGSPRVSCDKDGNWGAKPVCNAVECDPYPGLTADCVINTRLSGQFLFIACRRDVSVTKTGPSVVKCINNKWVPDPGVELVACFCDCKVNVDSYMSVQNLDADGYLKHNHTLEWSCKNNGKEANEGPLRCVDGKIETPRCILEPETTTQLTVDTTHDKSASCEKTTTLQLEDEYKLPGTRDAPGTCQHIFTAEQGADGCVGVCYMFDLYAFIKDPKVSLTVNSGSLSKTYDNRTEKFPQGPICSQEETVRITMSEEAGYTFDKKKPENSYRYRLSVFHFCGTKGQVKNQIFEDVISYAKGYHQADEVESRERNQYIAGILVGFGLACIWLVVLLIAYCYTTNSPNRGTSRSVGMPKVGGCKIKTKPNATPTYKNVELGVRYQTQDPEMKPEGEPTLKLGAEDPEKPPLDTAVTVDEVENTTEPIKDDKPIDNTTADTPGNTTTDNITCDNTTSHVGEGGDSGGGCGGGGDSGGDSGGGDSGGDGDVGGD